MELKQTPLSPVHIELGARMAPFAGYSMPVEYSGITDEHTTVRTKVGVFDVSHMGEIWVKGPQALGFVQHVTTNDVMALADGQVQYTCFPNGEGGIVDDFLVYRINQETLLLVVNAANTTKDWDWLCAHAGQFELVPGRTLYNASDEIAQLAIQGPLAMRAMQKLTSTHIEGMKPFTFVKTLFAGIDEVILSTTGYTGAGGCEIYCANEDATTLWSAVMEAGAEFGIKPIGLGARDTLRLEMGYCLYGHDIDDTTSPIEAGLGWITKFVDGNSFIDRAKLEKQKAEGVTRRLVGFKMIDRGIPRQHYTIENEKGETIGEVTSGTMSPTVGVGVGMGYVTTEHSKLGSTIYIDIRGKKLRGEVVRLPLNL